MGLEHGVDFGAGDERHVAGDEQRSGAPASVRDVLAGLHHCAGKIARAVGEDFDAELVGELHRNGCAGDDHDASEEATLNEGVEHIAHHCQNEVLALFWAQHRSQTLLCAAGTFERQKCPNAHARKPNTVRASATRSSSDRITVCATVVRSPSARTSSSAAASTASMTKPVTRGVPSALRRA